MTGQQSVTLPDEYISSVLPGLLDLVRRPPKKTILDLGPALGENIRLMQGSKLYIANFYESLIESGGGFDAKSFPAACARHLAFPEEVRFDLVLVWDLFNYLGPAQVETLAERLVQLSRPGTRIMAMVSIQRKIPDRPFRFVIRDRETLRYELLSSGLRECPRHNESDLLRRMEGFRVERGMLLRNGMREYIFVRDQAAAETEPASAGAAS